MGALDMHCVAAAPAAASGAQASRGPRTLSRALPARLSAAADSASRPRPTQALRAPHSRKPASRRILRVRAQSTASAPAALGEPLKVIISGAPASGKGTQCEYIVQQFGLVHISAGDLLRAEVSAGTENGKLAKSFMDAGQLVPDHVVNNIVKDRLSQPDAQERGWLLDGYPRSASQADSLVADGVVPDVFVVLNVPDEVIVERVVGRRMDPDTGKIYHLKFFPPPNDPAVISRLVQRSDDNEDKVQARLDTHARNVNSVLSLYEGKIFEVDGNRDKNVIFSEIATILENTQTRKERASSEQASLAGSA